MTPRNSKQNVLSLVDIRLICTGMVRCELALWSGVFASCLDSLSSLCLLDLTDPLQRLKVSPLGLRSPWLN